jgi:hypothetical protein
LLQDFSIIVKFLFSFDISRGFVEIVFPMQNNFSYRQGPSQASPSPSYSTNQTPEAVPNMDQDQIYQYILDLTSPTTRENALLELSKKREAYDDLAPTLWHSFGNQTLRKESLLHFYRKLLLYIPCLHHRH